MPNVFLLSTQTSRYKIDVWIENGMVIRPSTEYPGQGSRAASHPGPLTHTLCCKGNTVRVLVKLPSRVD